MGTSFQENSVRISKKDNAAFVSESEARPKEDANNSPKFAVLVSDTERWGKCKDRVSCLERTWRAMKICAMELQMEPLDFINIRAFTLGTKQVDGKSTPQVEFRKLKEAEKLHGHKVKTFKNRITTVLIDLNFRDKVYKDKLAGKRSTLVQRRFTEWWRSYQMAHSVIKQSVLPIVARRICSRFHSGLSMSHEFNILLNIF